MNARIIILLVVISSFYLIGCGMNAKDYFLRANTELEQYECEKATQDFKIAADMELEDEGNYFPIYMLGLGLSRYYCNDLEGSLKSFGSIDQYTILRSNRDAVTQGMDFLKSKGNRVYELTEREETLLHYYMGMINFRLENYEDAMIEFKKVDFIAEGNYSKLPIVALMRGLTYEKLGDQSNAFIAYKKIVEQNPESPVGYILSHRLEPNEGNRTFWENELKSKFQIQIQKSSDSAEEILTIIECQNYPSNDDNYFVEYDAQKTKVYLFDTVNPDFSFADFAGGMLKEVGSKMARDLTKNVAASLIPGGGLLAGLVLGNDKAEDRAWFQLPKFFLVDLSYIDKNSLRSIKITRYDEEDLEGERVIPIIADSSKLIVAHF